MIVTMKETATQEDIDVLVKHLELKNIKTNISKGMTKTVIGLIGDTSSIDINEIEAQPQVEKANRITEPYKKSNRKFHPTDTVIDMGNFSIGDRQLIVIAGPCSVESEEQIVAIAKRVKAAGATMLRGGAFKPRTSPYAFQGLRGDGLNLLKLARQETGLKIVSEIMSIDQLDLFDDIDMLQVGARNMQNFEMLKELGKLKKPILLKRGLSSTIEELLMSAEYILSGGNDNVILCERGIRTFENFTRNTLDISAIPILKMKSHLPVIVDPSHATGITWLVEPMSKSAIAAGADGLMIEVHNDPKKALSDGAQSITPNEFDSIMDTLDKYAAVEGRYIRPRKCSCVLDI